MSEPTHPLEVLNLATYSDERGEFCELWKRSTLPNHVPPFLQANLSKSRAHVLRGLHYHRHQWDLWRCVYGSMLCMFVDLRRRAAPLIRVESLSMTAPVAVLIPPGVAHGFYAPESATLLYHVTSEYDPRDEFTLAWNDPAVVAEWFARIRSDTVPTISERDRFGDTFAVAQARVAAWGL